MIKKITTYITPFQLERTLHIALPDNYYETQVHYPVMYMYDGHNLFQDHDATYGKSWGLEAVSYTHLDVYKRQPLPSNPTT